MIKYKVVDNPTLVRDGKSKAIINTDQHAYEEYKNKKNMNSKVINMHNELQEVKSSIEEIKTMLTQLMSRN